MTLRHESGIDGADSLIELKRREVEQRRKALEDVRAGISHPASQSWFAEEDVVQGGAIDVSMIPLIEWRRPVVRRGIEDGNSEAARATFDSCDGRG